MVAVNLEEYERVEWQDLKEGDEVVALSVKDRSVDTEETEEGTYLIGKIRIGRGSKWWIGGWDLVYDNVYDVIIYRKPKSFNFPETFGAVISAKYGTRRNRIKFVFTGVKWIGNNGYGYYTRELRADRDWSDWQVLTEGVDADDV